MLAFITHSVRSFPHSLRSSRLISSLLPRSRLRVSPHSLCSSRSSVSSHPSRHASRRLFAFFISSHHCGVSFVVSFYLVLFLRFVFVRLRSSCLVLSFPHRSSSFCLDPIASPLLPFVLLVSCRRHCASSMLPAPCVPYEKPSRPRFDDRHRRGQRWEVETGKNGAYG